MRTVARFILPVMLAMAACSGQPVTTPDAGLVDIGFDREPVLWPAAGVAPESGLFADYGLGGFNPWTGSVNWTWQGSDPVVRNDRLGFYAVANGRTLGFVGTDYPLTVLHEAYGPDYSRVEEKSFQDILFTVLAGGTEVKFMKSRIGRFSRDGVVGVTSEGEDVKLSAIFLSPKTEEVPYSTSIIVRVRAENTGKESKEGVALAAWPIDGASDSGTAGVIAVTRGDRKAWVVQDGAGWNKDRKFMSGVPKTLKPGEAVDGSFFVFFTRGDLASDPAPGFLDSARSADLKGLLKATTGHWNRWFSEGMQMTVPDPRVEGLVESFLYTIAAQTGLNGALSPMSHYGLFWTRDLSGPLRMLIAASRTAEVKKVLDYHMVAACRNGGFFNALEVDYPSDVPCAITDWSALPVMKDKTAAEAPSYIPHLYEELYNATGDLSLISERLPMLRYALEKQGFADEYFLPFSDDETFRPQMGINTGVGGVDYVWHENAWSLQSSLLFLAASDGLVRALGLHSGDSISVLRDKVLENVNSRYWQESAGIYLPFYLFNGMEQYMHPYEDANLTVEWMHLENLLGQDRVRRDLDTLINEAWREKKGIIQTWRGVPFELVGYKIKEGIFTGMTPGFTLYALSRHRPDLAEKAFNVFPSVATSSGNVTEVMSTTEMIPVMPIYDRVGGWSEVWARFRPWEGGQDGEAIIHYLTGLEPDATAGSVRLVPRLPNNWHGAEYKKLMASGCDFNLRIEERSDRVREHRIVFSGAACDGLKVSFRAATWACGERDSCSPAVAVRSGGEAVAEGGSGTGEFFARSGAEFIITATAK